MKKVYIFCSLGSLAGLVFGVGCWGAAEGHCGNLEGNQTCAEQGRGAYCNTCILESNGCTDVPPSADCRFAEAGTQSMAISDTGTTVYVDATNTTHATTGAGASGEGTTVALSGESGTTTGGPECVSHAECEEPGEPFCGMNGECVASCDGTGDPDAACMGLGAMTPLCFEGDCVACEDRLLVFDSTTDSCVSCTEHDQCASGACDIFVGLCFDPEMVIDVGDGWDYDNIAGGLAAVGEDRLGERRGVLALHGQASDTYFNESITIGAAYDAIAIIAAPRDLPDWNYDGTLEPTLTVVNASRAYLDRILMRNGTNSPNNGPSLRCEGARVDIRRSRLVQYDGGGIEALGHCDLVVQNSFIGDDDNNVDAVVIEDESVTASIIYSTIGGGDGGEGSALRCLSQGPNVHVRNSLLVALSTGPEVICPNAMVMNNATEIGLGVNMSTNWFSNYDAGDFHLTNNAPAGIIIADWLPGDPTTDIDGNLRITTEDQLGRAGADVP